MIPPVRLEVTVAAAPETAFAVFTDRIADWWPLHDHSVHGDGTVAFVDGAIVETSAAGVRATWGEVTSWDPPRGVGFTWHPGGEPAVPTAVSVRFSPTARGTVVVLEHAGWEVFDDSAAARAAYEEGWPGVLASFRDLAADRSGGVA